MSDMTTIETCKNCGLSYRASLAFPHECAEWTKGKPIAEPIGPRNNESLSEHLIRITAQRNRYWEQVEVLTGVLRKTLSAIEVIDFSNCREGAYDSIPWQEIETTLAAVAGGE